MIHTRAIKAAVVRAYDISPRDIEERTRQMPLPEARQVAYWLARKIALRKQSHIAREFRRDHTTIIHGVRAVEKRRREDPEFAERLFDIVQDVREGVTE